ncbi:glutamyl-tRNA reductase [Natronomonas sp. EA1]|uniref:glutamyl-tRNA reductase n=1 Tax=Natronomonas sp. EA1 TaxID=3421655 RepID=UPI003EB8DE92
MALAARVVSHRTGTSDDVAAASDRPTRSLVRELLDAGATEAFVLQTCTRAETYVVADSPDRLLDTLGIDGERFDEGDALDHLLAVAAGLDSIVIGEDGILGQLRRAVADARAVGGIGPVLDTVCTKAIRVGERVRSETSINEGVTSLASAAVRLASEGCSLADATALVIGAGETGERACRALVDAGVGRLYVANRTRARAETLAALVGGEVVDFAGVATLLPTVDLVVTATGSPTPILDAGMLTDERARVVIDLAQPRDVAPDVGSLAGVTLHDLDSLRVVTRETRASRQAAAADAAAIVREERARLDTQLRELAADATLGALYRRAETTKRDALDTALAALELTATQEATLSAFADALVSELLAAPTRQVRTAARAGDEETLAVARALFELDAEAPDELEAGVADALADVLAD